MFSRRLDWDLRPNPLSELLAAKRAAGARVFDLTESNPTRAGFEYPAGAMAALADERSLRYEPSARGILSAREAVAAYHATRARAVSVDRVLITASTSEAYAYLFKLLADPDDEVLTPRPSYPLFEFLASMDSVKVQQYPLRYDGTWHVDFDALERAITGRTRAIVVVNPNNPTGSFLKSAEAERLQQIAAARGIAVLVDEVFADYGFAGRGASMEARALTFSMSGLSKIAGLPQLKLGWIVADGPGADAAMERLELIADTYLSVGTPVQIALPELLRLTTGVGQQIRERTRANLDWLRQATRESAAQVLNVEGGWSAVLQVPRTRSEEEWALRLLRDAEVLVQPGFFFDFESEAFLVLSLLTPPDIYKEGVRRILAEM